VSYKNSNLAINPFLCGISDTVVVLMKVSFIVMLLWLVASSSSYLMWIFSKHTHLVFLLILILGSISGLVSFFRALSLRIAVKQHVACISKGFLISKQSFFRITDIYHVDIKQSLINRLTGTFSLAIHTHGDSSEDLVLNFVKDDFKNTDVYSFIMAMRKDNENS